MSSEPISATNIALARALRKAIATEVRIGKDLTFRQLSILLIVHTVPKPQTVRGLAQTLSVSKPVVTRAFDRLEELNLMRRQVDLMDRRSVIAQRTPKGAAMVDRLKVSLATAMGEAAVPSQ